MNRKLFAIAALFSFAPTVFAWSNLGHATIARIAEKHLTPAARTACEECLGGASMVTVSSDADICRGLWTVKLDFVPTNQSVTHPKWVKEFDMNLPPDWTVYSHTFTADVNCRPYRTENFDGEYKGSCLVSIVNLTEQLKSGWRTMNPEERKIALSLLIHLVGDAHCPDHIVYDDENSVGQMEIMFMDGKHKMKRHDFWDDYYLKHVAPWSFSDLADLIDTYSPEYISEITSGDIWDWGYDSALCCKVAHEVKKGELVPRSYAVEKRGLLFSQLANGGYRLAALLNGIFN